MWLALFPTSLQMVLEPPSNAWSCGTGATHDVALTTASRVQGGVCNTSVLLVFDWLHSVDKITIMWCCCFHRISVYFRVFRYSKFISLNIERALLWQVLCHKHEEGYFRSSRKILCRFQIRVVRSKDSVRTLVSQATSVRTMRTFHLDSHLCPEASNHSRLHPFERLSNTSERFLVFDK
jgi:hypothetical protein